MKQPYLFLELRENGRLYMFMSYQWWCRLAFLDDRGLSHTVKKKRKWVRRMDMDKYERLFLKKEQELSWKSQFRVFFSLAPTFLLHFILYVVACIIIKNFQKYIYFYCFASIKNLNVDVLRNPGNSWDI